MLRVHGRIAVAASAALLTLTGAWSLGARSSRPAVGPRAMVALDSILLRTYQWRSIGPDKGGRSIGVSGVKGRPQEAYFGAVGGGLWKTTNGGNDWVPVTDGQIGSTSVGAVAVSESNPDVVYLGTGETCIRGNIIPGDGVYISTDAGKTWTKVGFSDRQNISEIRIHPTNPDVVWVAAFGFHGAPNAERGVFKTRDGGRTWRKVLYRDDKTGAIDLSVDRSNPNVLYAAMWEAFRNEYTMSSGGPGSGLFKSTDGGESWTEITRRPGLPSGVVGRIGVDVSGADPNRVYALVENENGGLFSSDNAGGGNATATVLVREGIVLGKVAGPSGTPSYTDTLTFSVNVNSGFDHETVPLNVYLMVYQSNASIKPASANGTRLRLSSGETVSGAALPMNFVNGSYRFEVPGQPRGTLIYWVYAETPYSNATSAPARVLIKDPGISTAVVYATMAVVIGIAAVGIGYLVFDPAGKRKPSGFIHNSPYRIRPAVMVLIIGALVLGSAVVMGSVFGLWRWFGYV